MAIMYDFGELLRELRVKRNYTQEQLAKKLNKSKSSISKYESNQKLPSLETMIDISRLFNTSLDYLAGLEKKESVYINDLTPNQIDIIGTLVMEFHKKKNYTPIRLTQSHFDIINNLIAEFMNPK